MNIDKKIIVGVRNKDANAKKELISLTRNHLIQTIYKRYIGLEEKEINDILQATYTYAFTHMDKLSDDKNFLKWITVLLNKQLREYMQAENVYRIHHQQTDGEGKKAAQTAVYAGIFCSIFFLVLSQSWMLYTPSATDTIMPSIHMSQSRPS